MGIFIVDVFPPPVSKRSRSLRQRAEKLKSTTTETLVTATVGIIPVQMGDEYLGFPLEMVIDVDRLDRSQITPVPKAPSHTWVKLTGGGKFCRLSN